jgi:hypothetical protein
VFGINHKVIIQNDIKDVKKFYVAIIKKDKPNSLILSLVFYVFIRLNFR